MFDKKRLVKNRDDHERLKSRQNKKTNYQTTFKQVQLVYLVQLVHLVQLVWLVLEGLKLLAAPCPMTEGKKKHWSQAQRPVKMSDSYQAQRLDNVCTGLECLACGICMKKELLQTI